MKAKVNKITIHITQGDIFAFAADGIVHVTDPNLTMNPALVAQAGPTIEQQTKRLGWCDVGSAVLTDSGSMENAIRLIHAVGPRWGEGSERGKLANTTWAILQQAEENKLKSVVLPAISVGANGYPLENCAITMLTKIIDFTFENVKFLRAIYLCLADETQVAIFEQEFHRQLEALKDAGEGKVNV